MSVHLAIEKFFPELKPLSVGELLRGDCFRIPEFQRPYAWKEQQIDQFWEDISDGYRSHNPLFLGIMVFQRTDRDRDLEIIDGHQRLCTIFAMLLITRKLVRERGGPTDSLDHYIWKINLWGERERQRLVLTNPDDSRVLEALNRGDESLEERLAENRLNKACRRLMDKLRREEDLLGFADFILNQVFVVKILVGEQGDPFLVFEVLNARGLELTCWDLLKNRLLGVSRVTSERERTRELINSILNKNVEGRRVEPEFLTKFLRHFWLSREKRVPKPKLYKEINNYLARQDITPSAFASELLTELENYLDLIEPGDDTIEARDLEDLDTCGFEQGRPLLMAVKRVGTEEDFIQALKIVSTLHVRYHVCDKNPNELERFFSESAISYRRERNMESIRQRAAQMLPPDEQFIDSLVKEDLSTNLAKYLLRKVEETRQGPEALEERPIGSRLELEHIMPKKRSGEWPNHDPSLVNKLGNLTLIGPNYNRRVRNRGFEIKRQQFQDSELAITRELANFSSWGREEIERRGRALAEEIAQIFRI